MECSICLENINKRDEVILDCNHYFHKRCIFFWKTNSKTCPLCRCPLNFCHINLIKGYIQLYYDDIYPITHDFDQVLSKLLYLTHESTSTLVYTKKISIYYVIMKIFEKSNIYIHEYLNLFVNKLNQFKEDLSIIIDTNDECSKLLLEKIIKRVLKLKKCI